MHQAANVIYLFERAQGPGRVVSVWVESTEQMIAGALIAQRLNKTEGRKAALGASVISCQKKPPTSCEWEMNRWRLDWKIEARLRNRASFVAEWQNEVSWSF